MRKGPQGQKRLAGRVAAAILVAKITTGETEEKLKEPLGKMRSMKAGAAARAKNFNREERSAIATKAVAERWG